MHADILNLNSTLQRQVTPARIKILHPLTSAGNIRGEVLSLADSGLQVRVPSSILVGSMIQIRTKDHVSFGEVRSSVLNGTDFELQVEVQRSV